MITGRTVFIVGAGASAPYGFPLGRTLVVQAIRMLRRDNDERVEILQEVCRVSRQDLLDFARALERAAAPSLDLFLEGRAEYMDLGRAVMAAMLIPCEDEDALFRPMPDDVALTEPETRAYQQRWYDYALNRLEATPASPCQNLSVLTFNYDRSFEHFILVALQNRHGLDRAAALELMRPMPIIHLHGDLGKLAEHANALDGARPYSSRLSPMDIGIATKRIRIVHEDLDNEPQFARAKQLLAGAESIWFLGFGYLPRNVARLGKQSFRGQGAVAGRPGMFLGLWGTAYGLRPSEMSAATAALGGPQDPTVHLGREDEDVLAFLRRNWITD